MRKRVLILCDKSPRTSFGRIAETFHRATRDEFDASMLWLCSPKDFPDNPTLPGLHCWSPSREMGRISFPFQLAKHVQDYRPDWVILIRPELGFLVSSLRKAAPSAKLSMMIHDTFAETLYPDSFKFKLINRFWIRGSDQVDGFFFNSNYTHSEAQKVFALHGPQTLCGCVVDPQDFYPLKDDMQILRRKWFLDPERPVLLNVSLDEPRKNLPVFFALAARLPHVQFVRIGKLSPWIQEYLTINNITNVTHKSGLPLDALREFYHLSDALVFPSLLEGFGYPPLEALACGTPAIASNTSAMAETLPGVATLVDKPLDLDEWEHKIRMVLERGKLLPPLSAERLASFGPIQFARQVQAHAALLLDCPK